MVSQNLENGKWFMIVWMVWLGVVGTGCRFLMDIPDPPLHEECGNGIREGQEECDGDDLNGQTCVDLGFSRGHLGCLDTCRFDTDSCTEELCGPATCNGCCTAEEACLGGLEDAFCGSGGQACVDCVLLSGHFCQEGTCEPNPCVDPDGDGRGEGCPLGPDACEGDPHNWTEHGCTNCRDADGDGFPGTDCDLPEDYCDHDPHNWTEHGCTNCRDADGDGLIGTDCDVPVDCDDSTAGIAVPCQDNGCPQGWVYIPPGPFQRGCNAGELDNTCEPVEQPRHTVTLGGYCMEQTEVSVAGFRACRDAGVCTGYPTTISVNSICNFSDNPSGRETHPVNCITWNDARQYCQLWKGGDFPTEAQWEKAARGPDPDTRKFPWGMSPEPNCTRSNYGYCYSSTPPVTWPVGYLTGTAGDSPYGLKDMAGNLWEMTLDSWNDTAYSQCGDGCTEPLYQDGSLYKVIRGGGFHHAIPGYHRVVHRAMESSGHTSLNLGFRCRRMP